MVQIFLSFAMIFVVLATAKTILFIKNPGHRRFAFWFFFPRYDVIPSSRVSRKNKEFQNKLSVILFIMLLVEASIWLFMKKFS